MKHVCISEQSPASPSYVPIIQTQNLTGRFALSAFCVQLPRYPNSIINISCVHHFLCFSPTVDYSSWPFQILFVSSLMSFPQSFLSDLRVQLLQVESTTPWRPGKKKLFITEQVKNKQNGPKSSPTPSGNTYSSESVWILETLSSWIFWLLSCSLLSKLLPIFTASSSTSSPCSALLITTYYLVFESHSPLCSVSMVLGVFSTIPFNS